MVTFIIVKILITRDLPIMGKKQLKTTGSLSLLGRFPLT